MIRHVASIAEIVEDFDSALAFYQDVLGLKVERQGESEYAIVEMPGVLHFGLWSRENAAEATFGNAGAAEEVPLGFSVGFEVDDVSKSSQALAANGINIVQPPKIEPWEQETSRFISWGGALCEVSSTPWARQITQPVRAE